MAEKSTHSDIRKYALRAAKAERKHMHRQEARVSSRAALVACCCFAIVAIAVSLYAFFSYPRLLAAQLSGISLIGAIFLSVLCFVFSDKLEASAAVELFRDIMERFGSKNKDMGSSSSSANEKVPQVIFGKSDED